MGWTNDWNEIAPANDLMNRLETAAWLGVHGTTLDNWVRDGHIPDGVRIGKTKVWSRRRLVTFIEDKFVEQQLAKKRQTPEGQSGVR